MTPKTPRVTLIAPIHELAEAAKCAATALWRFESDKMSVGSYLFFDKPGHTSFQAQRKKTGVTVYACNPVRLGADR